LELSGYSKVPYTTGFKIVKTTGNIGREILPLYINVAPEKLPRSDERIRAIYYLANIKVPAARGQDHCLCCWMICSRYSVVNVFDVQSNGIIIADTANAISSSCHLI